MEKEINILAALHEKYANNEYILGRLDKIVENLPNVLQNIEQSRKESQERIEVLTAKQQQFITDFMATNQYFYCSTTNLFFKYDERHYTITTDDEIAHHVWQSMPAEEMIHDWQLSTKRFIVKRVRSRAIASTVPESYTIQYVLDVLCPAIFKSRDMAKYFLTAMGDRILKKSSDRVCIISSTCGWLLQSLKQASMTYLGVNAVGAFKHKYGRHYYANCRLIQTANASDIMSIPTEQVECCLLDILCVAIHYSVRYDNADVYLENQLNDYEVYSHISYLMHRTPVKIVNEFCDKYLESSDSIMRWKHMQYLWNMYLNKNQLPPVLYLGDLKTELCKSIMYDVEMDAFIGVSSRYLPEIDKFMRFWETTMIYVGGGDGNSLDCEYEIDELCLLFTKWYLSIKPDANIRERHISETKMLDLVRFYYPASLSESQKHVIGFSNKLWNKRNDVKAAMQIYKTQYNNGPITIYDMYVFYCQRQMLPSTETETESDEFKVSKQYFEKVVSEELAMYIKPGTKKISLDWISGL